MGLSKNRRPQTGGIVTGSVTMPLKLFTSFFYRITRILFRGTFFHRDFAKEKWSLFRLYGMENT